MILVRTFRAVDEADRAALARRVGAPIEVSLGDEVRLLTGLPEALATRLGGQGDAALLTDALTTSPPPELETALAPGRPPPTLELAGTRWALAARPVVMGIVNVTPDSFSDGGQFHRPDAAVAHAQRLVDEGADWLDIGGESTRPGAPPVDAEEECARVLPVVQALSRRLPRVPLSIDTSKAEVARRALDAGAALVNDVTALGDPAMAGVVAGARAALCVMHLQGTPRTMQLAPRYDDVVQEVADGLAGALDRAVAAGVARERVLVDPGIGFGKTLEHNLVLLRHLGALRALGAPVLLGTSRKSFLGTLTNQPVAERRVVSSAATVALAAAQCDADVFRVHDVGATREALAVALAVRAARGGGQRW